MAFEAGIRHTFPETRLSSGGVVNSGGSVFFNASGHTFPSLRYATGGFINSGGMVFSPLSIHYTFPDLRYSEGQVFDSGITTFSIGKRLYLSVLPRGINDDTVHLALGVNVDFVGYPRIGRKPLTVQFEQRSRGPIVEFYWLFGDGNRSFHTDPGNIYKRVGVYDVSLRIRISNRYYTCKKLRYIYVLAGDLIVSTTDTALRCAITRDQGIGMYRIPVADMPMPEARVGVLSVLDTAGVSRGLVLDATTGLWYDVTTREINGESTEWQGIGSVDLTRSIRFGEDKAAEKNKIRFGEGHLGVRPIDEKNRGLSGYDDNGFPDGMEATLKAYVDGEQTTPFAEIRSIPFNDELKIRGDLKADKKIEATRVQWELITNRGAHLITDRQMSYVVSRKSAPPPMRIMSEANYQRELADIVIWPAWIGGVLRDRKTGARITGATGATAVTGLDSRTGSAIKFSSAIVLGTASPTSLFFWATAAVTVKFGTTTIPTTAHDSITIGLNTWTLYYADSISEGGSLSITPSGELLLFDLRCFRPLLSSAARAYYFDDVEKTGGKVVLPR